MIVIKITITPGAEMVVSKLPQYGQWELVSENYNEDGTGVVVVNSHEWDLPKQVPYAVEQALDTNPDVIEWDYI